MGVEKKEPRASERSKGETTMKVIFNVDVKGQGKKGESAPAPQP